MKTREEEIAELGKAIEIKRKEGPDLNSQWVKLILKAIKNWERTHDGQKFFEEKKD